MTNFSGRPATTSTMSGRSVRSALSTSIRRRPCEAKACRQARISEDLPVPRAGEQHVVGRAAGHELLGVARDLVLLHIDVLQVGQLHGADMAHGLQQTAAVGALAIAPGDGGIPVCGDCSGWGRMASMRCISCSARCTSCSKGRRRLLWAMSWMSLEYGSHGHRRWICPGIEMDLMPTPELCAPAAIESWQQPGTRPAAAGGTVGGESGAVVGVDAHVVVAQIAGPHGLLGLPSAQ